MINRCKFIRILLIQVVFLSVGNASGIEDGEKSMAGTIMGAVVDGVTQQPLIGANVFLVENPKIGTTSNKEGLFILNNVDVGEYRLRISLLGYQSGIVTNVVVSTGRSIKVKVRLNESSVEMSGVEVQADYFSSAGTIGPVSTIGLSGSEVLRSPGASQDMQRIVQSLPGVAGSTDQTNELLVRGGAPNENLTVMDYIEIPSTNHYPNQFNSGGPINMVNVDLIEDIRFSTGGFPAQYGDKLSSVMDITIREGDRKRTFATNTGFNFAGFSTVMEGGLDGGRGSWIFSARRSFLETVDNIIGISSIGLTAIPKYYDLQGKAGYDLSPTQKIILSGIYGNDKILITGDPEEKNSERAGRTDSAGIQYVDFGSQQYAAGISLKSLWGSSGFSVLTLSGIGNIYRTDVRSDFTSRTYNAEGKVVQHSILNSQRVFNNRSDEHVLALKYDAVYRLLNDHELSAGAQLQTARLFDDMATWYPDTAWYDFNNNNTIDPNEVYVRRPGNMHHTLGFGDASKIDGYVSDKIAVLPSLTVTAGIRYDYFSYSQKGNLSPRLSLSYELFPPSTRINAAYGEYYQTQSYPLYSDNGYYGTTGYNKSLDNSHARHVVLGIEYIFAEGLKASIEGYYKEYSNLPFSESFIYSADKTYRGDKILNVGKKRTTGIELFLQQKQVSDFYGTFSFSYSTSTTDDPRLNLLNFPAINVGTYTSDYSTPIVMTVIFGKIVKDVQSDINTMPFFIKYPAVLLPFSDDMEFSFRYRFMSGNVYTPRIFVTNEKHREGGITWSRGAWVTSDAPNSTRYPDYQRLDVQWISRYHLENWNIVVFLQIQNLLNRANVSQKNYNSDGTIDNVYQFSFFPVGGISVEF